MDPSPKTKGLRLYPRQWNLELVGAARLPVKYATRKIHNYIRDPSGLFSIISHLSLSIISLISSLSLKLY